VVALLLPLPLLPLPLLLLLLPLLQQQVAECKAHHGLCSRASGNEAGL
jgi:hypothetical protein